MGSPSGWNVDAFERSFVGPYVRSPFLFIPRHNVTDVFLVFFLKIYLQFSGSVSAANQIAESPIQVTNKLLFY